MLGAVTDTKDAMIAMCVPLAGFLTTWSFPIYLDLIKAKELDGFRESRVGIEDQLMLSPLRKVIMRKMWKLPELSLWLRHRALAHSDSTP